jgi:hypothetical protein
MVGMAWVAEVVEVDGADEVDKAEVDKAGADKVVVDEVDKDEDEDEDVDVDVEVEKVGVAHNEDKT